VQQSANLPNLTKVKPGKLQKNGSLRGQSYETQGGSSGALPTEPDIKNDTKAVNSVTNKKKIVENESDTGPGSGRQKERKILTNEAKRKSQVGHASNEVTTPGSKSNVHNSQSLKAGSLKKKLVESKPKAQAADDDYEQDKFEMNIDRDDEPVPIKPS